VTSGRPVRGPAGPVPVEFEAPDAAEADTGSNMASSRVAAARATSRVMYGRQEDLARLDELFEDVVANRRTGVALVEGEAGIGKTRTVREYGDAARAGGADVLAGGCVDLEAEPLPYAPLVEVLADLVRREGAPYVASLAGPTADELARLVPSLRPGESVAVSTPASASRLFQALCSVLDRLAGNRPLVLVIEDVHWADSSTRDLLTLLVHQLRSAVMVVLTLRTDEADDDPDVRRFTTGMARRADLHLHLGPLSREDQARQMGDILGLPPTTPLVDEVYSRADGNPFFAEELLALGPAREVPSTVRELLLARLEALAPGTRQVLRAVAVAGRQVPHRLLDRVADVRGPALDEALRPAVDRHVLVVDPADGGSYRFRHALLQESIASTCLPGESVRLHRRLAEALSEDPTLAPDTRFIAGRIAGHWYAAGDGERALVTAVEAAREAEQSLGFSQALAQYRRVLTLLDVVPDADSLLDRPRYRLLWAAAETAYLGGDAELAASLVRQAIAVVDASRRDHHAYLYERLGRYLWMAADGEAALAAYEHAMALVEDQPVSRWHASIVSGYSQVLMLAGRFAESMPYARRAIAMAQERDDARSIEGHARNNLGVDLALLGHPDEGIAELAEARAIAEEVRDDVDDIGRAIVNMNSVLLDSGRLREAADTALEGIPVVDGLGLRRRKGVWCRCDAAQPLLFLGRNTEALRLTREALDLSPDGIDEVRSHMVHGQALFRLGELSDAEHHLAHARDKAGRILDGQIHGYLYAALVEVHALQGNLTEALALAHEGSARLLPTEDAAFSMMLYSAAASAAADLALASRGGGTEASRRRTAAEADGDAAAEADDAAAAVTTWVTLAEQAMSRSPAPSRVSAAYAQVARCELARARSLPDAAAWADVAALWDEVGEPYRAALARRRETEALLDGSSPDRPAAQQALRQAWRAAQTIGAAHLEAQLADLARRARIRLADGGGTAPESTSPLRLTPREREVLRHVAEGMTDRQIGARLFISPRTVERHVSNVLAKSGVSRRAELVALAHRYVGLVDVSATGPEDSPRH
jgi:DNA-binding NarL/FixJ family response regulator